MILTKKYNLGPSLPTYNKEKALSLAKASSKDVKSGKAKYDIHRNNENEVYRG